MKWDRIRYWGLIAVVVFVMLTPVWFYVFIATGLTLEGGSGSPTEARRLRPVVEAMPVPTATSRGSDPSAVNIVFPKGEWVVGIAKDSHGMFSQWTGGGTVVIKDSRGRVRCFFGHVCGNGNLGFGESGFISLDSLDAHLAKKFTEQPWP